MEEDWISKEDSGNANLSGLWILPYAYIIIATCAYSFAEFPCAGSTAKGWWNEQRVWLYKRVTPYLFALTETILKLPGFAKSGSLVFNVLAPIALFCLFCLVSVAERSLRDSQRAIVGDGGFQMVLSGLVVIINLPLYRACCFKKTRDGCRLLSHSSRLY